MTGEKAEARLTVQLERGSERRQAVRKQPAKPKRRSCRQFHLGHHRETPSEARLRVGLKKAGLRFGQEVPVKGFTVDFLVDEWLVVEVDGESHLPKGRSEKDASGRRP